MSCNFSVTIFTQKIVLKTCNFTQKTAVLRFLSPRLCFLEATDAVHLSLIGKLMMDFLLVITEPFSLGVITAEALRVNID